MNEYILLDTLQRTVSLRLKYVRAAGPSAPTPQPSRSRRAVYTRQGRVRPRRRTAQPKSPSSRYARQGRVRPRRSPAEAAEQSARGRAECAHATGWHMSWNEWMSWNKNCRLKNVSLDGSCVLKCLLLVTVVSNFFFNVLSCTSGRICISLHTILLAFVSWSTQLFLSISADTLVFLRKCKYTSAPSYCDYMDYL
eukprot:SAG11_NODE_3172_length_2635_cov_2.232650_1_plen_195_part_00